MAPVAEGSAMRVASARFFVDAVLGLGGRAIVLGAPRTGKSTLTDGFVNVLCTDPAGDVKEPRSIVEYVPDDCEQIRRHGKWSGASQYVADEFLCRPGPWLLEGVGAARALRKWHKANPGELPPCELLLWLHNPPWVKHLPGQASMAKGIVTVMDEIGMAAWLAPVIKNVELEREV